MATAALSELVLEPQSRIAQPLPGPRELKSRRGIPREVANATDASRQAIRDILQGRDAERLFVLAGPCSIHDREAALEYAARLAKLAQRHSKQLVLVMRSYFEKPRSTLGWKGLMIDPDLDGSCDLARGLELSRELLLEITSMGVPCGSEILGPLATPYLEDLLSWAAIGARTVESQPHRELASGLAMPVGVKNGMDGRTQTALDALRAIREPHTYLGLDGDGRPATIRTQGNADAHLVLRGGGGAQNSGAAAVRDIAGDMHEFGLSRPLLVDCSHGNSGKDHRKQGAVCREVLAQVRSGQRAIAGFALESHLHPGRQNSGPGAQLAPGVSITDACIGWSETEDLLAEAAEAVAARS